jgi:hypothetical protein
VILPAGNRGFDQCDSSSGSGDKTGTDITNNTNQENRWRRGKWKIPVELKMHLAQISRHAKRNESDEPIRSSVDETDLLTDLEISRKREQWRRNSVNYRARQRNMESASEPTPGAGEHSGNDTTNTANQENCGDDEREADCPGQMENETEVLTHSDIARERESSNNVDSGADKRDGPALSRISPEIARKREQWRRNSANYRARQRKMKSATERTPLEIAQHRERWRQSRAKVRETKQRKKQNDVGGGCEAKCFLLKPVSSQTQASVMARLREALGPDKLDECVCLLCDRTVLRWDAVRVHDEDWNYISKLKAVLSTPSSGNDGIPAALVKQYDCSPLARELSGMWLSPPALYVYHDDSCRLWWWCMVCNECNRSIKRLKMPKFSIANGFFVGQFPSDLDEDLTSMTIPERMLTQLVAVCSTTRVIRGGRHRCI